MVSSKIKLIFVVVALFLGFNMTTAQGQELKEKYNDDLNKKLYIDKKSGSVGPLIEFRDSLRFGVTASVSEQLSEDTLESLKELINYDLNKIYIVDLRQETHGFVNGIPVSFYGFRNSYNKNKSIVDIKKQEDSFFEFLNKINKDKVISIHQGVKLKPSEMSSKQEVKIKVHLAETEQQISERLGFKYKRFYVLDHAKPDDLNLDLFVDFTKDIPTDSWLHFHCRGGRGRSTSFLAMYDMIKHKDSTSFDEILTRQKDLGGVDLFNIVNQKYGLEWKADLAKSRLEFLKKFYKYVQDPNGYAKGSWSEWINLQK